MHVQKVSWKRLDSRRSGGPPGNKPNANPKLLGGLLLLLALMIIYRGGQGQKMVSNLESYLAGTTQTQAPASSASPSGSSATVSHMQSALTSMTNSAKSGDWQAAQGALHQVEMAWGDSEATFVKKGVSDADLNGFTADLADMALAVATKNMTALNEDVTNAQKTLRWMSSETMSGMAPTLKQMTTLVDDLNTALQKGDTTQAMKDARALKEITDNMQKGF